MKASTAPAVPPASSETGVDTRGLEVCFLRTLASACAAGTVSLPGSIVVFMVDV